MYYQGSKSHQTAGKNHAYTKVEVHICTEETRLPDDPKCATPSEIDSYLVGKYFYFTGLESVVDFKDLNSSEGYRKN